MDKVIDGIDVSGCKHYRAEIETKMPYGEYEIQKDKCHYSGIEIIQNCKGNKDCIYKQLKRLQAEYDDLHLTYAGCKTANTGLQELNQKLQAENERLKEELRTERIHSSQIEELEESLQHAKAENEKLIDQNFKIAQKYTKLEQENKRLIARLRPLEDSYFNGLSSIEIAELAKKNIRITAENRKLEDALQEIKNNFMCFRSCMIPFHVGNKENLPHNMADAIQNYCESIMNKINEVIGAE